MPLSDVRVEPAVLGHGRPSGAKEVGLGSSQGAVRASMKVKGVRGATQVEGVAYPTEVEGVAAGAQDPEDSGEAAQAPLGALLERAKPPALAQPDSASAPPGHCSLKRIFLGLLLVVLLVLAWTYSLKDNRHALLDRLSERKIASLRFASTYSPSSNFSRSSHSSPSSAYQHVLLLVSLFFPDGKNDHFAELFAAVGVNLQNPHFSEVHVLFELSSTSLLEHGSPACARLPELLQKAVADLTSEDLSKLRCVPVQRRPTYADFFNYANNKLRRQVVALANADVVFDESIGPMDYMCIYIYIYI